MTKFFIICVSIFALYIAFNFAQPYDSIIEFNMLDYHVETTLFAYLALTVAFVLLLFIILKILFFIIRIPSLIVNKFRDKKAKKVLDKLVDATSLVASHNYAEALKIIDNYILPSKIGENLKQLPNLIKINTNIDFDSKLLLLKDIAKDDKYKFFAANRLANLYYDNARFVEAEEFAVKAYNEDENNSDLITLLIRIYAHLGKWEKMIFVISKLKKVDEQSYNSLSNQIATFYLKAAKDYAYNGDDYSKECALSALEHNPAYIDAIKLFIELSFHNNNGEKLKVIRNAFELNPCFELAELFIKNSHNSPDAIYQTLASIAPVKGYGALYLAIASALNLSDRIQELRNMHGFAVSDKSDKNDEA